MKCRFERVLRPQGECFTTEEVTGPIVDCVFHVHPEPELTWVESSHGVRFIGDDISEFHEGDLVLIGPMLPHHYMNSPKDSLGPTWSRLKVIKFAEAFTELLDLTELESIRTMFEESESGVVFPGSAVARIIPLLREVFETRGSFRMVRLLELLAILADSSYQTLSGSKPAGFEPDARMQRVLDYIHGCVQNGQSTSLADTAKIACLTPQSFSRYFRQATRKRFTDYVTELKIGHACGLLANGNNSILEICLTSGFRNLSNFNRHFRRIKKLTPRQYRKAFQQQTEPT